MAASEWFHFSVPKRVMINNPRVGFLRFFLVLPIVMYLIYFVMVDGKNYQISEKPDGVIWATLSPHGLSVNRATQSFRYCDEYTGSEVSIYPQKCLHYDPSDVYIEEGSSGLILTAITQEDQTYVCTDATMRDGTCTIPWVAGTTRTNYVTNVEEYHVNLHHEGQATRHLRRSKDDKLYSSSAYKASGQLVDHNGDVVAKFEGEGLAAGITVGNLLNAAGVKLDEDCSSPYCPGLPTSKRATGIVLLITVEYDNLDNMEKSPKYEIHVRAVESSVYTKDTVSYSTTGATRSLYKRSGIRLVFVPSGLVGRFDFPLMLTYAASTLFFFFIISYFVDFLLLYALPNRRIYRNIIYEEPINPDSVEEKVRLIKSHKMYRVLNSDDATAVSTHLVKCENESLVRPGKPTLYPIANHIVQDVNLNMAAAEEVLLGMLTCEDDPAKQGLTLGDIDGLFRFADKENNRKLTHAEVVAALESIGIQMDPERVFKIMHSLDEQENPVMTKEHFQSLIQGLPMNFEVRCKMAMDQATRDDKWSTDIEARSLDGDFVKLQRENESKPHITRDQFQMYLRQERKFDINSPQFDALWLVAAKGRIEGIIAQEFIYWTKFMELYTFKNAASKQNAAKDEVKKLTRGRSAVTVGGDDGSASGPAGAAGGAAGGMSAVGNVVTKNQLNQINWATAKSQFRQIATHVNALHEKYIELARITRLLQLKYLPHTITDGQTEDFEPITLEGDWRREKTAECQLN